MPFTTFGTALVRDRQGPLAARGVRVLGFETQQRLDTFTTGADPQPQALSSDSDGYVPEFKVEGDNKIVWLEVDGLRKPMVSFEALELQAINFDEAHEAVAEARTIKEGLEDMLLGGTEFINDAAVELFVRTSGMKTRDAVVTMIDAGIAAVDLPSRIGSEVASYPAVIAAAEAALNGAAKGLDVIRTYTVDDDVPWRWFIVYQSGEVALGQRNDGSFYPEGLDAGAPSLADQSIVELTDEQGWRFAIYYAETGEVAFGQRNDGSMFPAEQGGGGPTEPEPSRAPVTIHGDSLTQSWGSYAEALSSALNRPVTVHGNPGQTSRHIAARQGGEPFRVNVASGAIPASGPVDISLAFVSGVSDSTLATEGPRQPGSYSGALAGVAGVLQITAEGVGTFTRDGAGRSNPVAQGTPFVTGAVRRKHYPIIWAGRNNFKAGAADAQQIVRDVGRMLDYSIQSDFGLVLSIPPWVNEEYGTAGREPLDLVNGALRDAFPTLFFDSASLLRSEEILEAVGVTPTGTDTQNIADGLTPESFRSDAGHLNAKGYEALNLIITDVYTARGWI